MSWTQKRHLFISGKGADEFSSSSKHQHPISRQVADVFWEAVTLATMTTRQCKQREEEKKNQWIIIIVFVLIRFSSVN